MHALSYCSSSVPAAKAHDDGHALTSETVGPKLNAMSYYCPDHGVL